MWPPNMGENISVLVSGIMGKTASACCQSWDCRICRMFSPLCVFTRAHSVLQCVPEGGDRRSLAAENAGFVLSGAVPCRGSDAVGRDEEDAPGFVRKGLLGVEVLLCWFGEIPP